MKTDKLFEILTITGINYVSIRKNVHELSEDYMLRTGKTPQQTSYSISKALIMRSALKLGGVGAVSSSSSIIPGLGSIAAMLFTGLVDFALLLKEQIELCYKISAAYNVDLETEKLKAVTLAIVGFSVTAETATHLSGIAFRKAVNKTAEHYMLEGIEKSAQTVAKSILQKMAITGYKFLPLISVPVSVAINVASIYTVGNQAIKYFNTQQAQ
ncbi:magnetosome protein Mad31 [Candidatus Magnetoovum chiemensis]|nr:magnetosome protein Mad31 [Candidatus Magnetoovum chiemensis]